MSLVDKIQKVLPQTQCQACGFDGCAPYAQAIAEANADIDLCRPGGRLVVDKLSRLTGRRPSENLNQIQARQTPQQKVMIDVDVCIGCRKCIDACPVDAILGANKMLHRVIEDECNGCELCIPVCPVDCMHVVQDEEQDFPKFYEKREHYFERHQKKMARNRKKNDDYQRRHAKVKLKRKDPSETIKVRRDLINQWLAEDDEKTDN